MKKKKSLSLSQREVWRKEAGVKKTKTTLSAVKEIRSIGLRVNDVDPPGV